VRADVFFWLAFAAALFLLGMGPGGGRFRLYMPPLVLAGGALWTALFGRLWARLCERALTAAGRALRLLARPAKRAWGLLRGYLKTAKKLAVRCKKGLQSPKMVYNNGESTACPGGTFQRRRQMKLKRSSIYIIDR
jgi:hypothetical protein